MEQFEIIQLIGEGTYGQVFKAKYKFNGKVVAIKKFKESDHEDEHVRKTVLREIRVLKHFRSENIVRLLQVFREEDKLFLVFEYVERTVLEELEASPEGLSLQKLKEITYQMLKALDFLHSHDLIHRDVKPENLLVNSNGLLKVCDFGFARSIQPNESALYTDYVSTRWYRSPELLVGDANYSKAVDIWAVGCIYAEMFNGQPLFPGNSDLDTLKLILEMLGGEQKLTDKQINAFLSNPIYDGVSQLPEAGEGEERLCQYLEGIDSVQLDFIQRCLAIDSSKRWSAKELLDHELFDEAFKTELQLNLQLWITEEEGYNSDLIALMEGSPPGSIRGQSPVFGRPSAADEFCNVNELLNQLEMRKSIAEVSMKQCSYDFSLEGGIQEENSEHSDSSSAGCGASSGQSKARVSISAYQNQEAQKQDEAVGPATVMSVELSSQNQDTGKSVLHHANSNGSVGTTTSAEARELIVSQLQQQQMRQQSQMTTQSSVVQSNSRSVVYPVQHLSMHQEHNRSLEVIIESPPNIGSTGVSGLGHITQNINHLISSQPHAAMLLSSQNGNIKSLQSSLKMKNPSGFSPGQKHSTKYGGGYVNHHELHRNSSQEIPPQSVVADRQQIQIDSYMLSSGPSQQLQNSSAVKKINITFHQNDGPRDGSVGSMGNSESYSPKLKHAYNTKQSGNNNFMRRNPNYMNQTARDTTPVKLYNQKLVGIADNSAQKIIVGQQSYVGGLKKGSSSLEKIIFDPAIPQTEVKQIPAKLPTMRPQVSNSQLPATIAKQNTQIPSTSYNGPLSNSVLMHPTASTYLQKQQLINSPIKLVAFPKLIDQIKENETHKSISKLPEQAYGVVVMQGQQIRPAGSTMNLPNAQQPTAVNFNNQYLNESIQAANQAIDMRKRGGPTTQTKDSSLNRAMGAMLDPYNPIGKAAYARTDLNKPSSSLYEMDSFPRRSITNRLKNVQLLQNKKKMRVFNDRTQTTTMFPQINNPGKGAMAINDQSIKIIDLQHSMLPTSEATTNYPFGGINNRRKPDFSYMQHQTAFKTKGGFVAAGGGFFKPKTPGEGVYEGQAPVTSSSIHKPQQSYQSHQYHYQQSSAASVTSNGPGGRSPHIQEKTKYIPSLMVAPPTVSGGGVVTSQNPHYTK